MAAPGSCCCEVGFLTVSSKTRGRSFMPKVSQAHLDARRQQIVDAARARFASHGLARTSMADTVSDFGLSNGAIYRYFTSKGEIVVAVCEQAGEALPRALTV